ncbi:MULTISPECIES: hypothetical protein [Serratia]|uniref:hypothetical protein n=1 Tax=Serratia TaxID=613 RepID=UPI00147BA7EC|nr:hypothetical protein [Serratia marcescens]NMM75033.1 hypothetical protein [Serratia marcescens]BEO88459.1 hypothetical protein SMETW2_47090 [Serratia marcescens]
MKVSSLPLLCGAFLISTQALASSPDAWTKHDADVKAACINASGLKNAKTLGDIVLFEDNVGSALLLEGTYSSKMNKAQRERKLCLYERTGEHKVHITNADTLIVTKKK